eukprot:257597-Chlamydomonas_euryale.AAC.3
MWSSTWSVVRDLSVVPGVGVVRTAATLQHHLAPPHRAQGMPTNEDAYQQEVLGTSLALAILGTACRVPDIASSPAMLERVPALVRVVRAGGAAELVPRPAAPP